MSKRKVLSIISLTLGIILLLTIVSIKKIMNVDNTYIPVIILYSITLLLLGWETLVKAFSSIMQKNIFTEHLLMLIAVIAAFVISEYFEAIMVLLFYNVGVYLEDYAVKNVTKRINSFVEKKDNKCHRINNGEIKEIDKTEVKEGDILVLYPGEIVPVDSVVVEGIGLIDNSTYNGEAIPVEVKVGDELISGTTNINSKIEIRALQNLFDSKVTEIEDIIEMAVTKKSKNEKFINKFAKYYTPVIIVLAVIICFVPVFKNDPSIQLEWIRKALIFLVASCPCALVISIPLAFFAGIGRSASNQIIFKGSNFLEKISTVKCVAFDKTGTLTEDNLNIDEINNINIEKEEFIKYLSYAEYFSTHPIANTIKNSFKIDVDNNLISNMIEDGGYGVSAVIDGKKVKVGKANFVGVESKDSFTRIHMSIDDEYVGNVKLSNTIRSEAKGLIKKLKDIGIKKQIILTGDSLENTKYVCSKIGINEYKCSLSPKEKLEELEKLNIENKNILYIGDGINDGPALARADVGMAIGKGYNSSVMKNADVVILGQDINKIATSIKIGKLTKKIALENMIFGLGIKMLVLVLAIVTTVPMFVAVLADVGLTIVAVMNAIRIIAFKKR